MFVSSVNLYALLLIKHEADQAGKNQESVTQPLPGGTRSGQEMVSLTRPNNAQPVAGMGWMVVRLRCSPVIVYLEVDGCPEED